MKADKLRKKLMEEYPMLTLMLENDDMPRVRRFLQALEALIVSLETRFFIWPLDRGDVELPRAANTSLKEPHEPA